MREDPPSNGDGTCALEGCRKQVPRKAAEAGDPFHSTECCKAWHGVVFPSYKESKEAA